MPAVVFDKIPERLSKRDFKKLYTAQADSPWYFYWDSSYMLVKVKPEPKKYRWILVTKQELQNLGIKGYSKEVLSKYKSFKTREEAIEEYHDVLYSAMLRSRAAQKLMPNGNTIA